MGFGTFQPEVKLPPDYPLLADDGSVAAPAYSFANGADSGVYLIPGEPAVLVFVANGSEVGRFSVLGLTASLANIGGDALFSPSGQDVNLQVSGGAGNAEAGFVAHAEDHVSARLSFIKTRGGAVGSVAAVQANDTLMNLVCHGADGSQVVATPAAQIRMKVASAPSAGIVPGLMVFDIQDAAGVKVTRLTLENDGTLTCTGPVKLPTGASLVVNDESVVGDALPGWGVPTGTIRRGTFAVNAQPAAPTIYNQAQESALRSYVDSIAETLAGLLNDLNQGAESAHHGLLKV